MTHGVIPWEAVVLDRLAHLPPYEVKLCISTTLMSFVVYSEEL